LIPIVSFLSHKVVFSGDFIPTAFNIPLPFVPSVDIHPLVSMQEKTSFLEEAVDNNMILLFEHDYFNECCTLIRTIKGIAAGPGFTLATL
jgi:hypothetical protein